MLVLEIYRWKDLDEHEEDGKKYVFGIKDVETPKDLNKLFKDELDYCNWDSKCLNVWSFLVMISKRHQYVKHEKIHATFYKLLMSKPNQRKVLNFKW